MKSSSKKGYAKGGETPSDSTKKKAPAGGLSSIKYTPIPSVERYKAAKRAADSTAKSQSDMFRRGGLNRSGDKAGMKSGGKVAKKK